MKESKFKTNIKCMGCVEKVKPFLNDLDEIIEWNVDVANPEKILLVKTKEDINIDIQAAVKAAGFNSELVK